MKTKRKNIFKSLLALTLALIMVLGVAPISELAGVNWAGIFAPKAEAEEVSDLPESFDLDVYSANIVFRDHESYEYGEFDYLQYCFNTIGSPAGNVYRIFSDNKDFVNSVEAYEAVKKVANPSNVLKDLNLQQRYEAVLYTVLFSSLYGEKLQKVSYSNAISDITGFTDKLINTPRTAVMFNKSSLDPDASDALKDTALAFITDGKDDKWASLSDYNGMVKKVSGSIDKVIGTATDIYNYAQKIGMYCALVDVGADAVRVLLDMKKNTTDVVLKSALQAVADSLSQDWYGVAEKVVLDVGFSVTDKAIKSLVEYGWLGCCEICPFLKGMMIGEKIGTAVCNLLFATDETIEQYEYLKIVTRIEDAAHAGLTKLGNAVDKNNNVVNASSFWFSLDFAATLYEESSNASIEFMYICCTKGLVNKIANFMGAGKDLSAEEFETSVNHCNELIQLHYGILRDSWRKYIGDDYPGFLLTLQKREAGFIPITSISVSKKNVTYYVGETAWAPSVTKNPSNANGGIAYKSDNEEVFASTTGFPIDEAKKAGTANVTVYSVDDPSIYDTFTVTVIEKNGETETKTDNGIIDSGTCGENLTWKLTEAGTLIISGTGAMKNCSNREEDEMPWYSYRSFIRRAVIANSVTSIGDYAFFDCSSLTSATIPNSVTSIGRDAFYYCNSLTSVIIPDSVTSIGLSAFKCCSSLTSVTIPNGVKSIESFAFRGCSSLISVTIPDSVTSIEWGAFEDCSSLTSVKIGNGVKSIGDDAFNGCSNLTSVTIPDSVTSIGSDAFYGCSGLTSVTIPDSVTSIGSDAFKDCSSLTSVTIGNGVTSTQGFTFSEYSRLTSVKIGNGVKRIRDDAFKGCSNLTSVTIGNSITSIGDYAFSGCSNLTSVTIPDSVTSIGRNTFRGCSSLTSVTIPNGVMSIGECTFYDCSSLANVTIPDSITSIGDRAFYGCSNLTSVTIGNSVTSIGDYAFSGCSNLTSVTIPDSVTSIGRNTFRGCSSLTSVTIPNGVMSIGECTFYDCSSLANVIIPDSITSIGDRVFYGCSSLTSVTIPNGVMSIGECTFYDCSSLANVTIPDSVTSIGWAAFEGCGSLTSVMIGNSVTCIIDRAFKDCSSLTSVTIPDSVTSIGDYAFKDCSSLTSVTIGNNVTSIGWSAFEGCGSLESVTIPDSVTSIRGDTFSGCSSLTSVTIGNSVTSIASHAFYRCSSLTSITIPDSVTSIGEDVFWDCSSLESVTIGNSVTSIGDSAFHGCSGLKSVNYTGTKGDWCKISFGDRSFTANPVYCAKCLYVNGEDVGDVIIPNDVTRINPLTFYNCKNLTSITIPNSVTSIGEYAFYGCNSLTSVTIPDSVTSIEIYAFYDCDSLTGVTIPDGVTSIGEGTFKFCSSLTSVTIPDSVTSIGDGAFHGCNGLTSIIIPNSVTSIGDSAFEGCSGLTSITIPNSVTSIGNFAFDGCTGLTSITIPNSVTSIENGAFFFCISLESVTIPDSVTSIGSSAFDYCKYLKDVYYCGTEAQWEKITIGDDNNCLTNATIHFNWKPCTHKWSSWQTVTAPTVDSEGLEKRVCSKCGAEETRAISKLEPVAVTSVKLSKSKKSLNIGDTFTLTATVKPNDATDKSVTWSSSDTSVATVDENGVVTAVAEGTATITATASNGVEASCTVTVKQKGDSFFKKILNVILAPFRAIINLFKKLFGK